MIFKIVNYTILGIAFFYVIEGVGLVEKGKNFPTLPRLEASASDPMAWFGAAEWGVTHLLGFANSKGVSMPSADGQSFIRKLEAQRSAWGSGG
jgi:hypothetical protein